ncbi:MAG: ABC transporter ATP-binding protein [Candidatus Margulisbacteria bacterium]|nr:ABC transporter ATP-binding protein [Candidatus Margulisiibacteriota bacterium]MBU1022008.1 ABC transporter ATP-binding protein [Candidatus Margulisiibacteriota bacterium]MBU1729869.1 ABC transporter ATP-binding protein [Candidatus Margulisiibacteriota bacterium]MBU1955199.1 ABC transporter ATP-binding protein [Candidatus Margulisiibacteriota bacterium]
MLLEVKNLKTHFYQEGLPVKAVDGISFGVGAGEVLGIVGESGSGKSTVGLSLLRLIDLPGKIVEGAINFEGIDLMQLPEKAMRNIRGAKISMIFQNPFTSLNPVFTVGDQIAETLRFHQGLSRRRSRDKTIEMLKMVHIKNPESRINSYPHQFSGGMQQRVMIAMALACNPKLLIADEPTTALDVTVQWEIIKLLRELKDNLDVSIILITHDFSVVAELCDKVAVMHNGKIVEDGNLNQVVQRPKDPYTQKLISTVPRIE